MYDQYDRGWCYAFAASDLISQHINKPVSRVHLSVLYNKYDFLNNLQTQVFPSTSIVEGGFTKSTLKIAKKHGLCLEKDLPSFSQKLVMEVD